MKRGMFFYKFQADRRPHTTHCKKHTQQETLYHTLQYTCPTRNLTAHIATDMSNRKPTSHIATNMPNRTSFHIARVFPKSDDFPRPEIHKIISRWMKGVIMFCEFQAKKVNKYVDLAWIHLGRSCQEKSVWLRLSKIKWTYTKVQALLH